MTKSVKALLCAHPLLLNLESSLPPFSTLQVGLDGIYCPLLLLNKKKYACISISERDGKVTKKKEAKGLDIVRRDWCKLAKRAGDRVLDFILSGAPVDDVSMGLLLS